MALAVKMREDYEQANKEYETLSLIFRDGHDYVFPPEQRKQFKEQLEELAAKRDKAKADHATALDKMGSDRGALWPAVPSTLMADKKALEEIQQVYENMLSFAKSITKNTEEVTKIIAKLAINGPDAPNPPGFIREDLALDDNGEDEGEEEEEEEELPKSEQKMKGKGKAKESDSMDIDDDSTSLRRRKRRRVEAFSASPITSSPGEPAESEREKLQDRLMVLEEKVSEVSNLNTQLHQDRMDALDSLVLTHMESFVKPLEEQADSAKKAMEETAEMFERSKEVADAELEKRKDAMGVMEKDLREMVSEVKNLRETTIPGLLDQVQAARKVKTASEARLEAVSFSIVVLCCLYLLFTQVERQLTKASDSQRQIREQIETTEAALRAYKTRPPSPPLTPQFVSAVPASASSGSPSTSLSTSLSSAYIRTTVAPVLFESIRPQLQKWAEALRADIEENIKTRSREVYKNVSDSLDMTKQTWEGIGNATQKLRQTVKSSSPPPTGASTPPPAQRQGQADLASAPRLIPATWERST